MSEKRKLYNPSPTSKKWDTPTEGVDDISITFKWNTTPLFLLMFLEYNQARYKITRLIMMKLARCILVNILARLRLRVWQQFFAQPWKYSVLSVKELITIYLLILYQVTEDQDALQETLKKKDRYIQEMEISHRQETRQLKNELEELNSEHEIELEMLKKEMEDLKLREERWKRVAELRKESDYDSSDVGSRDHSPEVEALKEQMAALHSNYEDEITILKEKLQTQIVKATEAAEKVDNQEFEFQESLSELKSAFESERNALLTAHQAEIDELKGEKARGMETSEHSSIDAYQKERYETRIYQLQEQVANLNSQLEERDTQMAQDLMIMKNEFQTQLGEARSEFESEKEELKKTVTELKTQADDINTKHYEDIEQMEQAFKREKEELLNVPQSLDDQAVNEEEMRRKNEEYESEIRELKENLQKERNDFIEARELLESTISEQEKEFEGREEKLRDDFNEEHQMKIDKVISDYEQRLQAAERRHLDGKELDEEKRTMEELQLEIKSMKRLHEREIERLHESLETLQAEKEHLKTEFDLVVTDLSSELETTKRSGKPAMKRKDSIVLKEQIETMKGNQDEQIRLLGEDIESYKRKVADLEGEVEKLRGVQERTEADMDLPARTVELQDELEVLKEESRNKEAELEEYKMKVSDLEKQLALSKSVQEQDSEQEEHIRKISQLENQLDSVMKAKVTSEAEVEEHKVTIESLRMEMDELNQVKQKLDSEVINYDAQLQKLNGQLKTAEGRFIKEVELQDELEVLKEESRNKEAELEEYKMKVLDLKKQLALNKNVQEQDSEQEEHIRKISQLENQLDNVMKAKVNSEAEVEEHKATIEGLRMEMDELNQVKQKLDSEVISYNAQLQKLNGELKTAKGRFIKEVETMRDTIAKLEAQKQGLEDNMEKQSRENKIDTKKLRESLEKVEKEKEIAVNAHKEKSEEVILGLHKKIEGLTNDCEKYSKEKDELLQEVQQLQHRAIADEDKNNRKIAQYEEEIKKLSVNIESLENYHKQSEIEKQDLQKEIENLRYSQEVEPMISAAAVDENFAAVPPASLGLEYEQQIKGLAEDYEEKIEKLQAELEAERSKSVSNTRRVESVNLEIETLRENLEEERLSVKNLQERIVKMQERHGEEVKSLKGQLHFNEKDNDALILSKEEAMKEEFSKTIKTLEADLETALQANSEQVEQINDAKAQLEKAWHTNEMQEREITNLSHEIEEFRKQQQAKEAGYTAEQLMAKDVHARTVQVLKADLEATRKHNQAQQQQINELKQELDEFQRQQIAHEANLTAEQLKASEGHARTVETLKADLDSARKLNNTRQEEIDELKQKLEDFQQHQIAHEANLTAEQLKISEAQKTQKQELKRKTKEIATLKFELENAQQTCRTQSEELARIKFERDEFQKARKRDEDNFLAKQIKTDEESARKIKALEEEVERKTEEMSKLFTVLDIEQKGRERVLIETEKHLTHMHQAEQDKIKSERAITELKSQNNEIRDELIKEKEKFASYVSQSEKAQFEEHEEVERLSRSLTESEMGKGKLTDEIETCKDELNKTQEKYNRLKEKFLALKQKRKEEKEKYDEVLLTPRFEMGLQTSLLEPEDLNQTKEQLSSSMREQVRLEDELEIFQRDMYKKKSEIQALKRANDVLRKQNQVLYLETESLRKSCHLEGLNVPAIQMENEKLIQDKENLEIENRFLKEALGVREKQNEERQEKDSSSDLLETELRELKEKHVRIEQENSKLKEESEFLLKQGKRLQSQVDQLEEEVKRLKRQTPLTSTPKSNGQSQAFVNEVIRSESGNQLSLESLPGSYGGALPSASLEAQRFAEENQRIKEQVLVLQARLRFKENDFQEAHNSQTEAVDDLVSERQALLAQMESMKETLKKYGDKGSAETNTSLKVSRDSISKCLKE